ncbi:MAG TPA: FkbM family methyltransferase [Pseudacidobacterium sp.]|jgi:FkbM family methyltransferase|nr:FkbM family methyltransferase [Pseudacidobacterium sp.]
MNLLHDPRMRALLRQSGMKQFAYKVQSAIRPEHRYEEKFSDVLLGAVHPGDCVWDVGANVGYYTKKFADRVGQSGKVIAFEPFEGAFRQLSAAVSDLPQVECLKVALGAEEAQLRVQPIAPGSTGNNLTAVSESLDAELICVKTGEKLIQEGHQPPSILKIDVEGFEEDVVWGFRHQLRSGVCRKVFIEVHYTSLDKRGFLRAPSRIVSMLKDMGFTTSWVDPSHLAGVRAA